MPSLTAADARPRRRRPSLIARGNDGLAGRRRRRIKRVDAASPDTARRQRRPALLFPRRHVARQKKR